MRYRMRKKNLCTVLIALTMILAMLGFVLSLNANANKEGQALKIVADNEEVSVLEIYEYEKKEVTAKGLKGKVTYQWQIYAEENVQDWVDIYAETQENLAVSKALAGALLDENQTVKIRCKAFADEKEYISDVLTVKILSGETLEESISAEYTAETTKTLKAGNTKGSAEFVTIKVDYVRWEYIYSDVTDEYTLTNMGPAFSSYIATIPAGDGLSTEVPNPTIVGFESYLGDATEASKKVEINVQNATEDITYVVNYKPAEVNYEVRYFFQNIYDDLYVENKDAALRTTGVTGLRPVEGVGREFDGFTNLYYQPDAIAADGSTVFEVYYERNYYLMEFNCNGGYGTQTIYVRHGTYVAVPEPTRAGYAFKGWDLISTDDGTTTREYADNMVDALPEEMPKYHSMYKALWESVSTSYTVVYWLENADDNAYGYVGSKRVEAMSATTVSGADDIKNVEYLCGSETHTHTNECKVDTSYFKFVKADSNVIVNGDGSSIVNVYYTRKAYTLRFYYAKSSGSGTNTKYEVVGGTTYPFGTYNNATENTSIQTLLENVTQWGEVQSVPTLKDSVKDRYETGTVTYGDYTYYYLEFTRKYGSDISELWAIDVFNPVKIVGTHSQCSYDEAFFSAWNGEYRVKYTQDHKGGNETIKGCYMYLDKNVIFDSRFKDASYIDADGEESSLVSFLGFWDNGANVPWSIPKLYRYNLMVESLSGNGYELYKTFDTYDDSTAENQTATNIKGMTYITYDDDTISDGADGSMQEYSINFYYKRNSYNLSFYNYNQSISSQEVLYGASLEDMYFEPEYPSGIEPGAYEFKGWYTTSECFEGTEVDWNEGMPAQDLTLYAKWVPVVRNVNFYLLYSDIGTGKYWQPTEGTTIDYPIEVLHGSLLDTSYNLIPERENYIFIGWFYFDGNEKKKFAPESMEVVRDLELFAEWKSTIPTTYKISYEAWDEKTQTKEAVIADSVEGYSTAGRTITFSPKAGEALYEGYQTGWFPEYASHSILMNSESEHNTYTFRYYNKPYINYKVVYKNRVTGEILGETDPIQTTDAIVTEKFKPFDGLLPEQYYIKRAIAYDPTDYSVSGNENHVEEENIIYFYYVPDESHVPFIIEHYKEQLNEVGTKEYVLAQTEQGITDVGERIQASVADFDGYTYIATKSTVTTYQKDGDDWSPVQVNGTSGVASEGGLEIRLYYELNKYDYIVRYLEYGTDNVLKTTEITSKEYFGATVSKTAEQRIEHNDATYVYYLGENSSDADRTKTITIRAYEQNSTNPNVITFYYNRKKIPVYYHVVCKSVSLDTLNGVSLGHESAATAQNLAGSKAMPGTGFTFAGWYYDEECTERVPKEWITDTHLHPQEINDADGEEHFYALFEPIISSIEISNTGADTADGMESNFIFQIIGKKGTSTQDVNITVVITENGSRTIEQLPIGDYSVKELTEWSWDYGNTSDTRAISIKQDEKTVVTFTNQKQDTYWLRDEAINVNKFQ